LEWSSTVTTEDLVTNETQSFLMSYSWSSNASLTDFRGPQASFLDTYSLFSLQAEFRVSSGTGPKPVCEALPLSGSLTQPPVAGLVYGGTQDFLGQQIWLWTDHATLVYGTAQTEAQLPVVIMDAVSKKVFAFTQFELVNQGPAAYWEEPGACSA
jgi:hypothetical protein